MFSSPYPSNGESPALIIGSDLKALGSNAEWRRLRFPESSKLRRDRIDKLFPDSGIRSCVLDVLASGKALNGVVIQMNGDQGTRFFCASFNPLPAGPKPKKVEMRACEMVGRLVLDEETGDVLEANGEAETVFGQSEPELKSQSIWNTGPLRSQESRNSALEALARTGSHYLGRFQFCRPDGSEVECESALVVMEE